GDVGDAAAGQFGDPLHDLAARARAWWVEDDQVDAVQPRLAPAEAELAQDVLHLAAFDRHVRHVTKVEARVADRLALRLDAHDQPVRADRLAQNAREQARAAVQVDRHLASAGLQGVEDRVDQGLRGARMDLPEAAAADLPQPVRHLLAHERRLLRTAA